MTPPARDLAPGRGVRRLDVGRSAWAVALATAIVLGSGHPAPEAPGALPGLDKALHFFVFGLLATLVLRAGRDSHRGWRGAIVAAGLVSLFGVTDELHQSLTPGRMMDYVDWIADTLGAVVAVVVYRCWPAYRDLVEWRLFARRGGRGPRQTAAGDASIETRAARASLPPSDVTSRR